MFNLMIFPGSPIEQPFRFKQNEPDEDHAVENHSKLTKPPEDLREGSEDECAQSRTSQGSRPTHDASRDGHDGKVNNKEGYPYKTRKMCHKCSGKTSDHAGNIECVDFDPCHIDGRGKDSLVIVLDSSKHHPDVLPEIGRAHV